MYIYQRMRRAAQLNAHAYIDTPKIYVHLHLLHCVIHMHGHSPFSPLDTVQCFGMSGCI